MHGRQALWPDMEGTQPFSPVVYLAVCSHRGEESSYVAAVERIDLRSPDPCRSVLNYWRLPIELVETRERGVDVRLVEQLDSTDQITIDGHNVDGSPLGVEAIV